MVRPYSQERGTTAHEIRVDGKMLDKMNYFQHIGSNRMKRLQHNTDKTLPIVFLVENVRSEAACGNPRR